MKSIPLARSNSRSSAVTAVGRYRSPLTEILGTPADPERFTDTHLDRLRRYAVAAAPSFPCRELEAFISELFLAPEVVAAYFRPVTVHNPANQREPVHQVLPFELATAAAIRAAGMPGLAAHERAMAWVAAYTYPSGIFAAAEPSMRALADAGRMHKLDDEQMLRAVLLRDALRRLRSRNAALGNTLAALMDCGAEDDCDSEQVARLAAAVRVSVLGIKRMWQPWQ
jgi:hypothetical protein